jgi:hypothetical protein
MRLTIDGEAVSLGDTIAYKSMMLSGVPNFAFAVGYTNSSWTLKVDLVCEHLCRLLAHMDAHGHDTVVPIADVPAIERRSLLDFKAGYVQRAVDLFPKQGSRGPWTVEMSYAADQARLRKGPIEDPALRFTTNQAMNETSSGSTTPPASTPPRPPSNGRAAKPPTPSRLPGGVAPREPDYAGSITTWTPVSTCSVGWCGSQSASQRGHSD